ncbi:MAG: hypothetical protein K2H84_04820 [Paramuribaculum sp.]|nr:hypothetical protein [Paramuribaculum sp.]
MKPKFLRVIPECYVDTNLIEYLLDAKVNHQHSCTKVVGLLKNKFKDQFAIGIIDKDKVEMGFLKECDEIAKTTHLTLLKHRDRKQYLITIHPAVDRFILDCAEAENVNPEAFNLPSKLNEFTKISKSVTSNTDTRFKALFQAVKLNREFRNLQNSLSYMIINNYQIDDLKLRELFEED